MKILNLTRKRSRHNFVGCIEVSNFTKGIAHTWWDRPKPSGPIRIQEPNAIEKV